MDRLLSRSLMWSVQAICFSRKKTIIKASVNQSPKMNKHQQTGKIIVYHQYFTQLLASPKPLRNQLVLELPCLNGLRSGEVSCLRPEYVNFESGDLTVLDSKKHELFTIPLDPIVAEHLAEYMRDEDIREGWLIRAYPHAHRRTRAMSNWSRGLGMSRSHINYIWNQECRKIGIPAMGARMGRAYFACKWIFIDKKSIYHLMLMLRHDSLESTEHYVSKLVDYADLKHEFQLGRLTSFSLSQCSSSANCPLAIEGCHCRMFKPQITEAR